MSKGTPQDLHRILNSTGTPQDLHDNIDQYHDQYHDQYVKPRLTNIMTNIILIMILIFFNIGSSGYCCTWVGIRMASHGFAYAYRLRTATGHHRPMLRATLASVSVSWPPQKSDAFGSAR